MPPHSFTIINVPISPPPLLLLTLLSLFFPATIIIVAVASSITITNVNVSPSLWCYNWELGCEDALGLRTQLPSQRIS